MGISATHSCRSKIGRIDIQMTQGLVFKKSLVNIENEYFVKNPLISWPI
jgi:hypothetical protein